MIGLKDYKLKHMTNNTIFTLLHGLSVVIGLSEKSVICLNQLHMKTFSFIPLSVCLSVRPSVCLGDGPTKVTFGVSHTMSPYMQLPMKFYDKVPNGPDKDFRPREIIQKLIQQE